MLLWLLVLIVVGACAGYWWFYIRVYRQEVFLSAMKLIEADEGLRESLGQPIRAAYWPSQETVPNARIEESEIDILWNIEGPKGHAKVHLHSVPREGKWENKELRVTLSGGKKMDVRDPNATESDAPPWPQGGNPKPEEKKPETNAPPPNIDMKIPDGAPGGDGK